MKIHQNLIRFSFVATLGLMGWVPQAYCNLTSVAVTVNKSPANFYTDHTINPGDVTITVNSTDVVSGFGLESWMTVRIALVTSPGGTTPIANSLDIASNATVNFTTGAVTFNPSFKCLLPFTGSSVRFQVLVSSPNGTTISPTSGTNPTYSSAINVYDYESSSMTLLKSIFFTDQDANTPAGARITVISTSSGSGFGLESWMRVHVAVVPVGSSGGFADEVAPITLTAVAGSQNYTPIFKPQAPHIASTVRYQLTISSANSTTPLVPRTGTNPSFTSAINIYDMDSATITVNKSPADFYTSKTINPSDITIDLNGAGGGDKGWMTTTIALVSASGTTPISNALSVSDVNFTTGAVTFNPSFKILRPFTGSSVRFQVTVSSTNGTTLIAKSGTNTVYSSPINIYDFPSVGVGVNKSPPEFYLGQTITPGDVTITVRSTESTTVPIAYGLESWMTVKIGVVPSTSTTPIANALSISSNSTVNFTTGTITFNPTFACLSSGQSLKFQVTVSSPDGSVLISSNGINPAYSSAFTVYDMESATITINKSPADFFTDKTSQPGDLTFSVNSAGGGLKGWMRAKIEVVDSPSGTLPYSNALSTNTIPLNPGSVTISTFTVKLLQPFTGNSVRFQVTVSSADGTVLVPKTGTNPTYSTATLNIYDFLGTQIIVLRNPTDFFTGKNANLYQPGVRIVVNSTNSAAAFGLEDWMRIHVAVVPNLSGGSVSNEITPTTLSATAGSVTYDNLAMFPDAAHIGSSVRFQVTITSANSNTPLTARDTANPAFSTSSINIYDFVTGTASVTRSPADFFTGKNANFYQPGMKFTVISTSPNTSPIPYGLEDWMRVYIAVAPNGAATSASNEVRPAPLGITPGSTTYIPTFYPETAHINLSARYQVTVTSSNSTTPLYPQTGTNPFYTTSINLYDYVLSEINMVQGPDPLHPKFAVDQDVNPNPYGIDLVIKSTEPNVSYGYESHMRVKIEMIDVNDTKVIGGISKNLDSNAAVEDYVPTADFLPANVTDNHPHIYPRYASYSQTVHFLVTVSSSNGQHLYPQFGVNPSTSAKVTVNAGTPTKLILLPMNTPLIRPDLFGRATVYDVTNPFLWTPSILGEDFRVKVGLTDRWSNPVDLEGTELQFETTTYLKLPAFNSVDRWTLDKGIQGTDFFFNLDPWQIAVPITVTSPVGFTSDTIFFEKFGLPKDTIFAGPSPFNPKIGQRLKFGFEVDTDQDVKIVVLDIFGTKVWETTVHATANTMNTTVRWDGHNDRGQLVAAGVYWAILEKNGEWKSKRKFGVIK